MQTEFGAHQHMQKSVCISLHFKRGNRVQQTELFVGESTKSDEEISNTIKWVKIIKHCLPFNTGCNTCACGTD